MKEYTLNQLSRETGLDPRTIRRAILKKEIVPIRVDTLTLQVPIFGPDTLEVLEARSERLIEGGERQQKTPAKKRSKWRNQRIPPQEQLPRALGQPDPEPEPPPFVPEPQPEASPGVSEAALVVATQARLSQLEAKLGYKDSKLLVKQVKRMWGECVPAAEINAAMDAYMAEWQEATTVEPEEEDL